MDIILNKEDAFFPKRIKNTHKGDYGKLLLIAGSTGLTGCVELAANAAVKTGAGLVYVAVPDEIYTIEACKLTEAMPFPIPSVNGQAYKISDELINKLKIADAVVIGPGLGRNDLTISFIVDILKIINCPCVVDADALYALAANKNEINKITSPMIFTPHEGEYLRFVNSIEDGRENSAREFASNNKVTLVLKGPNTVIAFPDKNIKVCPLGGPGMAKGGSGDVLAGILGACICQFDLSKAIKTGVYLHSLAGDLASEQYGEYSATATNIIEMIPKAIKEYLS